MNSELYDKTYKLPSDVLQHLQSTLVSTPSGDGVRRAKFMLKNGAVTYQALKRIKNFFDTFNGENRQEFELAGGELMKSFIERTLNQERDGVSRAKEVKQDMTVDVNRGMGAPQSPRLHENDAVSDGENDAVKKNALAVIVNDDKQILLLKRSDAEGIWQPNKYALVGGGVEPGETPEEAVRREIKEETGLVIDKFNEKFTIQRNPDSVEHIFVAHYDGDPYVIKLNFEHTKYGWYSPEELHYLNTVPNLIDYINLAFKKYD